MTITLDLLGHRKRGNGSLGTQCSLVIFPMTM
jgi:hypothetical protein